MTTATTRHPYSNDAREQLHKDPEHKQLRNALLAGAASSPGVPADTAYFDSLRQRIRHKASAG